MNTALDFFRNGYNGNHNSFLYIAGIVLVVFLWQILGSIPFISAIVIKEEVYGDGFNMEVLSDIMNVLPSNLTFFFILLPFVFGLLGIFLVLKYLHKQDILSSFTSRSSFDWNRFFLTFSIMTILIIFSTLMDYWGNPSNYEVAFEWDSFLILAVIAIAMVPLQTTFEEWLFRGYLMQGFGYIFKNRAVPFIVTSLVFGLVHIANPEVEKLGYIVMINYVGVGVLLGIMTLMDEGLELAAGFHAANNLITALLVTADWTAFNTPSILRNVSEPEVGFDILFPILVAYPILLFVLARKYKWSNWKEKLFGKIRLNDDFTQSLPEN